MTPKSHRKQKQGPPSAEMKAHLKKERAHRVRFDLGIVAKDIMAMDTAMRTYGHLAGWEILENLLTALALFGNAVKQAQALCPRPTLPPDSPPRTL